MKISLICCADCGVEGTQWANTIYNIFLCADCASYHREIAVDPSIVKNVLNRELTNEEDERLTPECHDRNRLLYELHVPPWYLRPTPSGLLFGVLKQQWIEAKYKRRYFCDASEKDKYVKELLQPRGYFECMLYRKYKDSSTYEPVRVVIDCNCGILRFSGLKDKSSKSGIDLIDVNVCFASEKMGKCNGLQLAVPNSQHFVKNIFVYSDSAKVLVDFLQSIRYAKFNLLQLAYPDVIALELVLSLSHQFSKEGWLRKVAQKVRNLLLKRWYSLDGRYLYYFTDPLDIYCRGRIFIGYRHMGYFVQMGFVSHDANRLQLQGLVGFTIVTPSRDFAFFCNNEHECLQWVDCLNKVVNEPIGPKEAAKYRSAGECL